MHLSENTSLAPQGICGHTRCRSSITGSPYKCEPGKPRFLYGWWHGFQSEQRSEPSAVVGVQEDKVPQVSWHNFRYTYSTWANPSGESIKALQAQLGHTDLG